MEPELIRQLRQRIVEQIEHVALLICDGKDAVAAEAKLEEMTRQLILLEHWRSEK